MERIVCNLTLLRATGILHDGQGVIFCLVKPDEVNALEHIVNRSALNLIIPTAAKTACFDQILLTKV